MALNKILTFRPLIQRYIRRWERKKIVIPCKVALILEESGKVYTRGSALIRNISLTGALLGKIVLQKPSLPIKPFKIRLEFNSTRYMGIGATAKPVHFGKTKIFELGIAFEELWIKDEQ